MEWQRPVFIRSRIQIEIKSAISTSCFTRPDMTSWTKAMEAIVSHYEEDEKKRRMPRI